MCGRFTQKTPAADLAEAFDLAEIPVDFGPRYNIAPASQVLVVPNLPGPRRALPMQWGLVPGWATDPAIGNHLANARSETAADKPSFRQALRRRRGLLLMDGFYEWQTVGKRKVPHWFTVPGGGPFAVAALWEVWAPAEDPDAQLLSTTLLTCEPNPTVAALHDRMAVILPRAHWDAWLAPGPADPATLRPLLAPWSGPLSVVRVSDYVNVAGHEGPACIEPAAGPPPQSRQPLLL
ncbi:MAG: SOS response-associated peptidase [Deltaproteobacteria bacterium]|nr:SOS response-associated peptidase [Deltaproteobacteria bacterium]